MLGVVADDFTGATDIAGALVGADFRTTVCIGTPNESITRTMPRADAFVVALKTRTAPLDEALEQSHQAFRWLQAMGATQYYFKYCSTFDSTPQGNIGPVLDLLGDLTGADKIPVVPSYPANRRDVFRGYLFVGDVLLNESPMRHHPLTPMCDANLVRFLAQQTRRGVGLVPIERVHQGAAAIGQAMTSLGTDIQSVVIDAIEEADLAHIASACAQLPLISGGAALAGHFSGPHPDNARKPCRQQAMARVMLVGSASEATRGQLRAAAQAGITTFKLNIAALRANPVAYSEAVFAWVKQQWGQDKATPLVIHSAEYASEALIAAERAAGYAAAPAVERGFAALAQQLLGSGQRDFVVAGGETSGTIVEALGISHMDVGQEIAPGVVWTCGHRASGDTDGETVNLALNPAILAAKISSPTHGQRSLARAISKK